MKEYGIIDDFNTISQHLNEDDIMELASEMITIGTELATIAGSKSVEAIFDKIF